MGVGTSGHPQQLDIGHYDQDRLLWAWNLRATPNSSILNRLLEPGCVLREGMLFRHHRLQNAPGLAVSERPERYQRRAFRISSFELLFARDQVAFMQQS